MEVGVLNHPVADGFEGVTMRERWGRGWRWEPASLEGPADTEGRQFLKMGLTFFGFCFPSLCWMKTLIRLRFYWSSIFYVSLLKKDLIRCITHTFKKFTGWVTVKYFGLRLERWKSNQFLWEIVFSNYTFYTLSAKKFCLKTKKETLGVVQFPSLLLL